ncbi:MAG: hypothetical protein JSR24_11070 [Proteobacteria bacterium]|nr:hypothetical protein [Pseudomonadota bacterium]
MKSGLFIYHLTAVLLSGFALWSMRHERNEKATGVGTWVLPVVLSLITAAILLMVSPGKRIELWVIGIVVGFGAGLGAGTIVHVNKDFERRLVRMHRTWDGIVATTLLFLLALARIISSDFTSRQSSNSGLLGAIAVCIAAYLLGRALSLYFYTAPRTIHLDMVRGERAPLE